MKVKITATAEVELRPILLPNSFRGKLKNSQGDGAPEVELFARDLDANTLAALVNDFRDRLFADAGKQQPPTCAPRCSKCGETA